MRLRFDFHKLFVSFLHHLEPLWSTFWSSWPILGNLGTVLGHLRTILAALGGSWAVLGRLLAALGRVLNLKITRDAILSTGMGPKYPWPILPVKVDRRPGC